MINDDRAIQKFFLEIASILHKGTASLMFVMMAVGEFIA